MCFFSLIFIRREKKRTSFSRTRPIHRGKTISQRLRFHGMPIDAFPSHFPIPETGRPISNFRFSKVPSKRPWPFITSVAFLFPRTHGIYAQKSFSTIYLLGSFGFFFFLSLLSPDRVRQRSSSRPSKL